MQINYEHIFPTTIRKIINFSSDISDGQAITGVILSYFPKSEDEYKVNKKKAIKWEIFFVENNIK